jgi:trans-aconitate methyltransferase
MRMLCGGKGGKKAKPLPGREGHVELKLALALDESERRLERLLGAPQGLKVAGNDILERRQHMPLEFNAHLYEKASSLQKGWGYKMIADLELDGSERILDLGCGEGMLSAALAERVPSGSVVGLDSSEDMIKAARKRERPNLGFVCEDMLDMDFDGEFDLIYSNAALHWVKDQGSLLKASNKALSARGRIRWSFGGEGNTAYLIDALKTAMELPGLDFSGFAWPWNMPGIAGFKELAANAGFLDLEVWMEVDDKRFPCFLDMARWIDQPCLVPFLAWLKDSGGRGRFRDRVMDEMEKTGGFETFRRLNVRAEKG